MWLITNLLLLITSSLVQSLNICDSPWSRQTKEVRHGNLNFYLSPCGERDNSKARELCDPNYTACISKLESGEEESFIKDLGSPIRNSIEEGYGLHFKGSPCRKTDEFTLVVIRFICDYGLYEDKVSILQSSDVGGCVFVFLWLSPSACPREVVTSLQSFEACELHVKEMKHTVNLNNMIESSEPFLVSATSDRNYRFGICSGANEVCKGSVLCVANKDGSFISDLGFGTDKPLNWTVKASYDYWMTNVTLVYESYEALIHFNFLCTKAEDAFIEFVREQSTPSNKQLVIFNVYSKQACPVNVTECPFLRNSINYDLRSLVLKEWSLGSNISITLCRPNRNCPHENEAICSKDGRLSAYIQNAQLEIEPPIMQQRLRLTYNTTQKCGGGNGSIVFIFECHHQNLGPTLLETKGDGCHMYALWRTPFVCLRALGEELSVYLHTGLNKCLFGDMGVDLSPLFNEEGDIIVYDSSSNVSWAVNICGRGLWGGVNGTCGSNSAVCQLNDVPTLQDRIFPSKKALHGTSIGENNLINGIQLGQMLSLIYSSGKKCEHDDSKNKTTAFSFVCGAKQTVSKPEYIKGNNACQEKFIWSTHLVCPTSSISCEIDGPPGTKIDLGVLGGININDEVIVRDENSLFVFNICKELEDSKLLYDCPVNSAACMLIRDNETEISRGLGELRNPPTYNATSKEVYLDYTMGSLCTDESNHHTHYSTRIIFKCDWGRKAFSVDFIGRFGCQYRFLVLTDAACPRKKLVTPSEGCLIRGSPDFPNEIIDFSQMVDSNSSLEFKEENGNSYQLNICNSLPGRDPFAAMMRDVNGRELMLGRKSDSIKIVDKIIYVEYLDGDVCSEDPSLRYSVILRFICPRFDSPVYLDLVEKGRCMKIFNLYTPFVCVRTRGRCGLLSYEGDSYDFSPLIKPSDSSYVVNTSWHLNICQSIESCGILGPMAHPVSVCKQSPQASHRVLSQQFLINEKLELIYETGETCPADSNRNLSSLIAFSCDPHRYPGYPSKRTDSDSCVIGFDFPTALACKNLSLPYIYTSRSCKVYHSGLERFVDFSEVGPQRVGKEWTLNPCQLSSPCTVCAANGTSYGHVHSSQYDFKEEALIVDNRGGSTCNEGSHRRSSRIRFKCDRSLLKRENEVRILYTSPCFAEFEWSTKRVCIDQDYNINHFLNMPMNPAGYSGGTAEEAVVIITLLLAGFLGVGVLLYIRKHYGRRIVHFYRSRGVGVSSFVSYRRAFDLNDGDETLSSSNEEGGGEQYKMM